MSHVRQCMLHRVAAGQVHKLRTRHAQRCLQGSPLPDWASADNTKAFPANAQSPQRSVYMAPTLARLARSGGAVPCNGGADCAQTYAACGGVGGDFWLGYKKCCSDADQCVFFTKWYAQCLPAEAGRAARAAGEPPVGLVVTCGAICSWFSVLIPHRCEAEPHKAAVQCAWCTMYQTKTTLAVSWVW